MAAGPITLSFLDGGGATRTGKFWSSDGTTAGVISPMPGLLGADGLNAFSLSNPIYTQLVYGGAPINFSPNATANGLTRSRVVAAATTNATNLKASAGNIYEIDVYNEAAYDVFLKLYDKASAPTVGTDTPVWTIPIGTKTGFSREFSFGETFATGIAYAITKLQADSDTTAVVAGDLTGKINWV
jgi:hypothetical protein